MPGASVITHEGVRFNLMFYTEEGYEKFIEEFDLREVEADERI